MSAVDTLLQSETFLDVSHAAARAAKREFKIWSRSGFACRRRRSCDEGDYCYSPLFFGLVARANGNLTGEPHLLDAAIRRHPHLMPLDDYNEEKLWCFQADVIECHLSRCRDAGVAIPADVTARIA